MSNDRTNETPRPGQSREGNASSHPRRAFLKTSALVSAGLFLPGARAAVYSEAAQADAHAGGRASAAVLYGEGGLTSIAVADDSARLARHAAVSSAAGDAAAGSAAFGQILRRNVNEVLPGNVLLVGSQAPFDSESAVRVLRQLRPAWLERRERVAEAAQGGEAMEYDDDDGPAPEHKIALVLGWMAHQAARAALAPLHAESEAPKPGVHPSEMTVYHDAAVLRHRSAGKAQSGGSSGGSNSSGGEEVEVVARLFQEMGPRQLIRFHTFIPDYDDGSGWVDRLAGWRNEKEPLLRRLAEAYQAPDPEKLRRYVTEPNFYDESDAVLRVARALRDGEEPPTSVADAAAATGDNQSRYAQAVRQGYERIDTARRYLSEELGEDALLERLRS